ncbi:MAG TPA: hypothetical protein VK589_02040 [Chryseolinea sp.]|nr:hypothetical protein [Chryseolinea sp.]
MSTKAPQKKPVLTRHNSLNNIDKQMGLFDKIFMRTPQRTTLDQIKASFHFLTSDFHYELLRAEKVENYRADNFLVYRNDQSKIQIEICADEDWFHCELRRIINGQPASYGDNLNTVGFEDLAVIESDNKYNHFDYYAGRTGLTSVLKNTAKLLKRNSTFLTTDDWIDVRKIESLKFGKTPAPTLFSKIKNSAINLLTDSGYQLTLDNDELSPFDPYSMFHKLVFQKGNKKIEIAQVEWDYIYNVLKNGTKVFDVDISVDNAVELMINKLKANL